MTTQAIRFDLDNPLILNGPATQAALLAICARVQQRYGLDLHALCHAVPSSPKGHDSGR